MGADGRHDNPGTALTHADRPYEPSPKRSRKASALVASVFADEPVFEEPPRMGESRSSKMDGNQLVCRVSFLSYQLGGLHQLTPDAFPSVGMPHDEPPSPRFGAFGGDDFKFDLV